MPRLENPDTQVHSHSDPIGRYEFAIYPKTIIILKGVDCVQTSLGIYRLSPVPASFVGKIDKFNHKCLLGSAFGIVKIPNKGNGHKVIFVKSSVNYIRGYARISYRLDQSNRRVSLAVGLRGRKIPP